MPLYDFECKKCKASLCDELINDPDTVVSCPNCGEAMTKLPNSFSFSMTPGPISKFKKKVGKSIPPDYKTTGGANIYGVPRRS